MMRVFKYCNGAASLLESWMLHHWTFSRQIGHCHWQFSRKIKSPLSRMDWFLSPDRVEPKDLLTLFSDMYTVFAILFVWCFSSLVYCIFFFPLHFWDLITHAHWVCEPAQTAWHVEIFHSNIFSCINRDRTEGFQNREKTNGIITLMRIYSTKGYFTEINENKSRMLSRAVKVKDNAD